MMKDECLPAGHVSLGDDFGGGDADEVIFDFFWCHFLHKKILFLTKDK